MEKRKQSNRKIIAYKICSFTLIVVGIGLIANKYYENYHMEQIEQRKIDEFINIQNNMKSSIVSEEEQSTQVINKTEDHKDKNSVDYIAVLEIPKLNLRKGLYSKNSIKNDVNENIEVLQESIMPNNNGSNLILAGHSGSGRVAYFNNLDSLTKGDIAIVHYEGISYSYRLVNEYEIQKTGKTSITRNGQKKCLTLITCKHGTDKQVIYIFELEEDRDE